MDDDDGTAGTKSEVVMLLSGSGNEEGTEVPLEGELMASFEVDVALEVGTMTGPMPLIDTKLLLGIPSAIEEVGTRAHELDSSDLVIAIVSEDTAVEEAPLGLDETVTGLSADEAMKVMTEDSAGGPDDNDVANEVSMELDTSFSDVVMAGSVKESADDDIEDAMGGPVDTPAWDDMGVPADEGAPEDERVDSADSADETDTTEEADDKCDES